MRHARLVRRTPLLPAALLVGSALLAGCAGSEAAADGDGWSCLYEIDEDGDPVDGPDDMTEEELTAWCRAQADTALPATELPPEPLLPIEEDVVETPLTLDELLASDGYTSLPVVRTDFTDDAAWAALADTVTAPARLDGVDESYVPATVPVDDAAHDGTTAQDLFAAYDDVPSHVVLADTRTMREVAAGDEVTVLVVDLHAHDGADVTRELRVTTAALPEVEANLSILNLWLWEYAATADPDGVYRGFRA